MTVQASWSIIFAISSLSYESNFLQAILSIFLEIFLIDGTFMFVGEYLMKERWHIIFVNLKVLLDSIITPWSINVIVNIEVPLKVKFPNFNQLLFELSVVEINLIAFDEYLLTWKLIWKFSTSEYLVKMYNIFMIYYRFLGKLTAHNLASFKSEYVKFIMLLSAFIRLIPFNASLVHICSLFFFFWWLSSDWVSQPILD